MIKFITINFLLFISILNSNAELNLRISIDPNGIIREGSKAKISLSAAGNLSPDDPDLNIQGGKLNVRKVGKGFEFMRSNQGVTRVTTHTYELSGESGKYTIKGIFKSQDGTLYETESINLQIRKKTAQEKALDPQIIVNLANNEPFVGEPVLAEISLLLQPRTRLYSERNNIATLSGEGVRVNYIDGPKEAPPKNNKRVIKFLYEIAPLRAGDLKLTANYNPLLQIPSATGRRLVDERFNLKSEETLIRSKRLPDEGKPKDFSGAIGSFTLDLQADPLKLKVGEPIALRFTITGNGGFEFIESPTPIKTEGWKLYEPTKFDLKRGEGIKPSTLIFSQNLVAEKVHGELPTFRLTVFDSDKEQYVTLITDKTPIELEEISKNSSGFNITAKPPSSSSDSPNSTIENNADILMVSTSLTPNWSVAQIPAWKNHYIWITNTILIFLILITALILKFPNLDKHASEGKSPKAIIEDLKSKNLSAINFYTYAYECFERLQLANQNVEVTPIFERLSKKYEQLKYSGNNSARLEKPTKEESNAIIEELTKISKK
mgnify:FL=1